MVPSCCNTQQAHFCGQSQAAILPAAQDPGHVLIHFDEALMQADSSDCGHGWPLLAKTKGHRQTMPRGHLALEKPAPPSHLPGRWQPPPCSMLLSLWQAEGLGKQWAQAGYSGDPPRSHRGRGPLRSREKTYDISRTQVSRTQPSINAPSPLSPCPHARSLTSTTLQTGTLGPTQHLPTHLATATSSSLRTPHSLLTHTLDGPPNPP